MKRQLWRVLSMVLVVGLCPSLLYALGETDRTVIYQVTSRTSAGESVMYSVYSIVATETSGYWLQRTIALQPDGKPLSITQTLLDTFTHQPRRYIMHRPANQQRPENVIDLPLEKMGQEEILPTPLTSAFTDAGQMQVPGGTFAAQQGQDGDVTLWLSLDAPVLGVIKAERPEWTMELYRIDPQVTDLLPKKPKPGGIVYLE